jgi:quinol monooxygenase YgiN
MEDRPMRSTVLSPLLLSAVIGALSTSAAAPSMAREVAGVRYADIPAGAYSIVAEVRAKPGKEAELRAVTLPLVAQVRSDPKNLVYFLQEDREAPGRFVFYEIFATREDFEAHNSMPYVKDWFTKLPTLADGGVTVRRLQILGGDAPRGRR